MRKINYKSDFTTVVHLKNQHGEKVPWPQCDWSATFWTNDKARTLKASCINGQYTNCNKESDGGILFIFNSHHLGLGRLLMEPHFMLPNEVFSDGTQDIYGLQFLNIELVAGAGDCGTEAEVEAMLPYIKGDPFTYEDFTPEQIEDLQRPATEAAEKLDSFVQTALTAENVREENEKSRVSAEQTRVANETERQTAEATRQSNELEREKAESDREEAEAGRVSAEESRAEEFAMWETEIDSKADKAELSNVLAEEPLTSDNFPDINTYTREELKMDLFIDMWNSACGQYGKYAPEDAPDAEHPFLLNGLWLTYEEALATYYTPIESHREYLAKYCQDITLRTNICTYKTVYWLPVDLYNIARSATNMEVIRLSTNDVGGVYVSSNDSAFSGAKKLRAIYPFIVDAYSGVSAYAWLNTFRNCPMLEDVQIKNLKYSLDFRESPRLSLASLQYIVANAANTAAITITVHPEVYAKLNDETDAEWHALVAQGAERNINFATV